MLAIYHKSVKNISKKSYINRPLPPITSDIFSQIPTQDISYTLDSFVVPDDQISFIGIFFSFIF